MKAKILCGLVVCFFAVVAAKNYGGQTVVAVTLNDDGAIASLREALSQQEYDVWTFESEIVRGVNHIRVSSSVVPLLQQLFNAEALIPDVQDLIDTTSAPSQGGFFDDYQRYDAIVAFLQQLPVQYPTLVQYTPSIGQSVEGRDIPAVVLSAAGFHNDSIRRIFFQGGQHAREWIGPATVLYLTQKFLDNYGKDPFVTELLNSIEIVIVPLSNPDGYEYAHTNERLWRKNRRENYDGTYGVDLNRNWNDHWGGQGSSGTPSSDTYRGPSAFSEPESLAISQYIEQLNQYGNILGAIDFHSYSQLVLRPYGWTNARCPDEMALKIIGDGISYEIERQSGKIYSSQRSVQLYVTTGSASDWYYLEGIWAAYTIELRDTGKYGFVLPPAEIKPTGEEVWASMVYFCKTVVDTHP